MLTLDKTAQTLITGRAEHTRSHHLSLTIMWKPPRHNNPSLPPPAHILSKKVITASLNTNKEHLSFVIKGRINKETVIKCLLRHHLKRTLCAILAHWSMTVCWRCAGMSLRAPSVGFSSDLLLIPGDWLLKGTAAGGYKPNFWINYSNAVCPKQ